MNISDWLDEKEAEGVDVSQIELPDDLAYEESPEETIFFEEINPCGIYCPGNHPFSTVKSALPSNALDTGITAEVRTRRPTYTLQEWNGGCSPGIEASLSRQPGHT
ncbi:MAG: hypothetical protein PHT96_12685 [Syntrophorhabdaceae bacterium]|nr:hypothetical protein [Syntrophorhabdaceae bacterium]MDD4197244.1 hypothetical protein [Syntrophorhabdaceae bacterium]